MIVKQLFLRNGLLEEVDFKKTVRENQEKEEVEQQRLDSETTKTCPKCEGSYIPSQANHGSCRYHDGYIVDFKQPTEIIRHDQAQMQILRARFDAGDSAADHNAPKVPIPKLFWTCCLTLVADNQPCQTGVCGLPEQLKDALFESDEVMRAKVKELYEKNPRAKAKINAFVSSERNANQS